MARERPELDPDRRAERWLFFIFGVIAMYAVCGLLDCIHHGPPDLEEPSYGAAVEPASNRS